MLEYIAECEDHMFNTQYWKNERKKKKNGQLSMINHKKRTQ